MKSSLYFKHHYWLRLVFQHHSYRCWYPKQRLLGSFLEVGCKQCILGSKRLILSRYHSV